MTLLCLCMSIVCARACVCVHVCARACVYVYTGTYQHGGPEVKLVEELCNEDMNLHKILYILLLNLTDDVSQPLKLVLGTSHPDEVNLHTQVHTVKFIVYCCTAHVPFCFGCDRQLRIGEPIPSRWRQME